MICALVLLLVTSGVSATGRFALRNTAEAYGICGTASEIDGTAGTATLDRPRAVVYNAVTNSLDVAMKETCKVRRISLADGSIALLAGSGVQGNTDGLGAAAKLNKPSGLGIDSAGNAYSVEVGGQRIRKVTVGGTVTPYAGDGGNGYAEGIGPAIAFKSPQDCVTYGGSPPTLVVADTWNHRIRSIDPSLQSSTIGGDGTASHSDTGVGQFFTPFAVTIDSSLNVFVGDGGNFRIRKITSGGVVSSIVGTGINGTTEGSGVVAQIGDVRKIAIDGFDEMYVTFSATTLAESANVVAHVANNGLHTVTTLRPNGVGFTWVYGIAVHPARTHLFVGDMGGNCIPVLRWFTQTASSTHTAITRTRTDTQTVATRTQTDTRTHTGTVTRPATPTASQARTASHSAAPSATSSAALTRSATVAPAPSASRTGSLRSHTAQVPVQPDTASPTATRTATQGDTASPTATRSATQGDTASSTASQSAVLAPTPVPTPAPAVVRTTTTTLLVPTTAATTPVPQTTGATSPLAPVPVPEGTTTTVATTTAVAGAAGGPAAPLIQGAAITLTLCASSKREAEAVGAKSALVPYTIGETPMAGLYGIFSLMGGAAAGQLLVTVLVGVGFSIYHRQKGKLEAEESDSDKEADIGATLKDRMFLASRWTVFPGLGFKVFLYGFQGTLGEGMNVVAAVAPGTTVWMQAVGGITLVLCLLFIVLVQYWGNIAHNQPLQEHPETHYVPFAVAWDWMPQWARAMLLPRGYWRGKLTVVGRFRPYGMFSSAHVRWVSTVYLLRSVVMGLAAIVQPTTDFGCMILYLIMAAIFLAFAVFFAVARPHRALSDDAIASLLNLLTAVLALLIGIGEKEKVTELYLAIVYIAIGFVVYSFLRLFFEVRVWRPAEEASRARCRSRRGSFIHATNYVLEPADVPGSDTDEFRKMACESIDSPRLIDAATTGDGLHGFQFGSDVTPPSAQLTADINAVLPHWDSRDTLEGTSHGNSFVLLADATLTDTLGGTNESLASAARLLAVDDGEARAAAIAAASDGDDRSNNSSPSIDVDAVFATTAQRALAAAPDEQRLQRMRLVSIVEGDLLHGTFS
jgi:hypothetical protein